MSKKKMRKPKKRAPVKRSNDVLSSHFGKIFIFRMEKLEKQ